MKRNYFFLMFFELTVMPVKDPKNGSLTNCHIELVTPSLAYNNRISNQCQNTLEEIPKFIGQLNIFVAATAAAFILTATLIAATPIVTIPTAAIPITTTPMPPLQLPQLQVLLLQ